MPFGHPKMPGRKPIFDRFILIITATAIVFAMLPTLIGWAMTPAGYRWYGNYALAPGDASVYFSYSIQGQAGHIFMFDAFTGEAHRPTLFQPLWWLVGQTVHTFQMPIQVAFHLFRAMAVVVLVGTLWWAVKRIFPDQQSRRWGLVLALFGGGFGGFVTIFLPGLLPAASLIPPDVWVSEWYPSLTLLVSSHFSLVTSGLVFVLVMIEQIHMTGRQRVITGLVLATTLSIHPFHILTLGLIWMIGTLWRWVTTKQFPRPYVQSWLSVTWFTLPVLLWYGLLLFTDPVTAERARQNSNHTAAAWWVLIGLGAGLVLAVLEWQRSQKSATKQFLATWAAGMMLAIYAPVIFQRRLGHGLWIPVALLATPLVVRWWQHMRKPWTKTGFLVGITLLFFLSPVTTAVRTAAAYRHELLAGNYQLYYIRPEFIDLLRAISALDRHWPILAAIGTSNTIAGSTAHQVFIGLPVETLEYRRKKDLLTEWWATASIERQRAILEQESICYIVDGPVERTYGQAFQPERWPDLRVVWRGPTITLYQTPVCKK